MPQAQRKQRIGTEPPAMAPRALAPETLTICSFNIKFLGHYKNRRNAVLANLLGDYDMVVVQELVAPPYPATYPDGTPVKPDPEAQAFFNAMRSVGFEYLLSEEDTGPGERIHNNGPATEWFAVFYKPQQVGVAADLPSGFVADDRSAHPDYDRVPCAFAFRTSGQTLDFVLVNVHLRAGSGPAHRARRQHELAALGQWVRDHDQFEKDFVILGDMNIESVAELAQCTPAGFVSLNHNCLATTCSAANGNHSPFDHVMYQPTCTTAEEFDATFAFQVIDLIEAVRPTWLDGDGAFPGDPYSGTAFPPLNSDHHPVLFRMIAPAADDDPNP